MACTLKNVHVQVILSRDTTYLHWHTLRCILGKYIPKSPCTKEMSNNFKPTIKPSKSPYKYSKINAIRLKFTQDYLF